MFSQMRQKFPDTYNDTEMLLYKDIVLRIYLRCRVSKSSSLKKGSDYDQEKSPE